MSIPKVYQIAEFPNSRYKFDIYDAKCNETWTTILANQRANGAVGIINLGYFGLDNGNWASGCKIHGEWMCKQDYTAYGICIDSDGNAFLGTGEEDNAYSYAEALPVYLKDGAEMNRDQTWSANGTTTLGFKDGNLVCMICDKDNGQTSDEQIAAMTEYGCTSILRMDGSWSSHGSLGYGINVQPSQMRKDRSYLIIYDKEYVAPRTFKKVTIDPHGTGSSDKYADTFNICDEIKKALEETEGIECMISRYRDNPTLEESLRADQSDCWVSDLVFSINVNETSADGSTTYAWTTKTTSTAYKFANYILSLMKESGMKTTDSVKVLSSDPMLADTKACAALAMFVGDYSTKELRWKAVEISVKAICNQLGVEYIAIPEYVNEEIPIPEPDAPEYDPYNDFPDEELRSSFTRFREIGMFSSDTKMGEVVRYGDLTKALDMICDAIYQIKEDESSDSDNEDSEDSPSKDEEVSENDDPVLGIDDKVVDAVTNVIPNKMRDIANTLENLL